MAKFEKIFGKHSVKAVLLQRPQDIETIILAGKPEYYADIIEEAEKNNIGPLLCRLVGICKSW